MYNQKQLLKMKAKRKTLANKARVSTILNHINCDVSCVRTLQFSTFENYG